MTTGAREAALRPFDKPGRGWWLVVGALSLVVLAGVLAWVVQFQRGVGVAGYSDGAFWAIYEANLVTFIGFSYGGAVVSAILRLTGASWRAPLTRLAEGMAVVTVLVGSAFIIPHLGRPDRIWELVTRPNLSAPVFWDFVAIMTYTVASIVFFVLPLVPDMAILREGHAQRLGPRRARLYAAVSRGWVGAPRQRRVLAGALGLVSVMIIPLAVSVHSVLAWAFSLTSPPWWHESIWAPYFVVAALYSGVALVILVVAGFRRGYHLESFITERHFVRLGFILATFSVAYLYMTFADILPGAYVGEPGTAAVFHELLLGRFALWFWLFVLAAAVLPLLLVALPWTRNVWGIVAAAALVVPAMWLKRTLMVVAPATYDRVDGTFGNYHFTWVAVSVTLAGVAAVPLLLMVLFRVVPLLSIDEIEVAETASAHPRTEPSEPTGHDATVVGATSTAPHVAGAAGVLLLVALLGTFSAGAVAPARAATPQSAPTITINGVEGGGSVQLTATLTGPDDRPQANADVTFLLSTTVFEPQGRLVPLGSVTTDNAGTAQQMYRPTVTGPQEFVANYAATAGAKPVTASTTLTVTVAQSAYHPPPPKPLAGVGKILVGALFTLVAAVWLTLITQVVRVRRICRGVQKATTSSG
ncbi:MAG TPA: NrfD/PsrC family molybdoenzyme membrane anchor subunit [Nocardioidaceae bacterium]|nr:NrfD/PsrC family molybdoenzyme membrane anchor subunit [Nocardioidaceae bacterium]